MRAHIVGQAPGPGFADAFNNMLEGLNTDEQKAAVRLALARKHAVSGRVGKRLADLGGVSYIEFLSIFNRHNLVNYWPGPAASGKGDYWPVAEAGARARELKQELAGSKVILLGRNVARAFFPHFIRDQIAWLQWHLDESGTQFAVCPHPSGINRWWNNQTNLKAARYFWHSLVQECKSTS